MKSRSFHLFLWGSLLLFGLWLARSAAAAPPTVQPSDKTNPVPLTPFIENRSLRAENDASFLTGPHSGEPLTIALDFFQAHQNELGLTTADTVEMAISKHYTSQHTGTTHIYLQQRWQQLDVVGASTSIQIAADGSVVNLYTNFVGDLAGRVATTSANLSATEAVHAAATALGLSLTEPLTVQENIGGPAQRFVFSDGGISLEPIPAWLVYQPLADGSVRLAWAVEIYELSSQHWWNIRVDAVTGEALGQYDYVVSEHWGEANHASASQPSSPATTTTQGAAASQSPLAPDSYRVYPMPVVSPIYTSPAPPADARVLVDNPANALASPFGWHDTNGVAGAEFTTTQGNNVHAYVDADTRQLSRPRIVSRWRSRIGF